ncbi:hypothetical protein BS50DRAFT_570269 [Corynespora cassiicola Philippines]|uniref:Uncharacterized protein n=1 Tax=Corynespora cassiicola Philippines TaxID=1448308 RepID=A0A2T2NZH5_CORCC|nr:hypothetical protein BS50DRAFT_570269 [Corynespora cassiicola Philippines]
MKVLYVLLAAAASVAAQTECEPHEDHWHCPEGVEEPTYLPGQEPAATAGASSAVSSATPSVTASPSATETDDHDDHDISLTASGVCEPHGDHWHCPEGVPEPTTAPALSATTPAPSASATADHDHDDDDHAATASTCEPHGDHWHCKFCPAYRYQLCHVSNISQAPAESLSPRLPLLPRPRLLERELQAPLLAVLLPLPARLPVLLLLLVLRAVVFSPSRSALSVRSSSKCFSVDYLRV